MLKSGANKIMKAAIPPSDNSTQAVSQSAEYILFTFYAEFIWWAVLDSNQ